MSEPYHHVRFRWWEKADILQAHTGLVWDDVYWVKTYLDTCEMCGEVGEGIRVVGKLRCERCLAGDVNFDILDRVEANGLYYGGL